MPEGRRSISRRQVIAGFFLAMGLLIIVTYLPMLGAEETLTTRLGFGTIPNPEGGRPLPIFLEVPTVLSMLLVGMLYAIAGGLGLFERFVRAAVPLLWISAGLIVPAILIAAAAGGQLNTQTMIAVSLQMCTPLALGALAGIYCERSGVINIAIEGMMLMGAAAGFTIFVYSGNLWLGVAGAVLIGGMMALLHGMLSITFATDQIISGTVINILALGITGYVRATFLIDRDVGRQTLPTLEIPFLQDIPFIGPILFENKPIFYLMILLVIGSHIVLFATSWGLRIRSVGENPRAADTVGINVYLTRYLSVFVGGCIAGLAGAWFSLETAGTFDDNMTSGKGFIALAAMIFGKWTPFGSFGGAMLFGFSEALGIRFQLLDVPVPVQFLQVLPYVTTMFVLAGLIGRAIPPAAIGKPYRKA